MYALRHRGIITDREKPAVGLWTIANTGTDKDECLMEVEGKRAQQCLMDKKVKVV